MFEELTVKHSLKHYGRLQYMSFVKGMGVKVEEARNYFKREYSKGDPKKLNEYMYYVDHLYGMKGKKTDYTPWGCNKMITSNPPCSLRFTSHGRGLRMPLRVLRRASP
jgi:DNA primase large subunit